MEANCMATSKTFVSCSLDFCKIRTFVRLNTFIFTSILALPNRNHNYFTHCPIISPPLNLKVFTREYDALSLHGFFLHKSQAKDLLIIVNLIFSELINSTYPSLLLLCSQISNIAVSLSLFHQHFHSCIVSYFYVLNFLRPIKSGVGDTNKKKGFIYRFLKSYPLLDTVLIL